MQIPEAPSSLGYYTSIDTSYTVGASSSAVNTYNEFMSPPQTQFVPGEGRVKEEICAKGPKSTIESPLKDVDASNTDPRASCGAVSVHYPKPEQLGHDIQQSLLEHQHQHHLATVMKSPPPNFCEEVPPAFSPTLQDYATQLIALDQQHNHHLALTNEYPPLEFYMEHQPVIKPEPEDYNTQLMLLENQYQKSLATVMDNAAAQFYSEGLIVTEPNRPNLFDYQMQLISLEHQAKLRRLEARKEEVSRGLCLPTPIRRGSSEAQFDAVFTGGSTEQRSMMEQECTLRDQWDWARLPEPSELNGSASNWRSGMYN